MLLGQFDPPSAIGMMWSTCRFFLLRTDVLHSAHLNFCRFKIIRISLAVCLPSAPLRFALVFLLFSFTLSELAAFQMRLYSLPFGPLLCASAAADVHSTHAPLCVHLNPSWPCGHTAPWKYLSPFSLATRLASFGWNGFLPFRRRTFSQDSQTQTAHFPSVD